MKLRLRGSSLRIRLGQAEVASLLTDGRVEESVPFGPKSAFVYAIRSDDTVRGIEARLSHGDGGARIDVVAPRGVIASWAGSDEVGLSASQPIDTDGEALRILVEKDFACLKPRVDEDDADAFPNPSA